MLEILERFFKFVLVRAKRSKRYVLCVLRTRYGQTNIYLHMFSALKQMRMALVRGHLNPKNQLHSVSLHYTYDKMVSMAHDILILRDRYGRALQCFRESNIIQTGRIMRPFRNALPAFIYLPMTKRGRVLMHSRFPNWRKPIIKFISDEEANEQRIQKMADPFNIESNSNIRSFLMKDDLHVHMACQYTALKLTSNLKDKSFAHMTEHELVENVVECMENHDLLAHHSDTRNDSMGLAEGWFYDGNYFCDM